MICQTEFKLSSITEVYPIEWLDTEYFIFWLTTTLCVRKHKNSIFVDFIIHIFWKCVVLINQEGSQNSYIKYLSILILIKTSWAPKL